MRLIVYGTVRGKENRITMQTLSALSPGAAQEAGRAPVVTISTGS